MVADAIGVSQRIRIVQRIFSCVQVCSGDVFLGRLVDGDFEALLVEAPVLKQTVSSSTSRVWVYFMAMLSCLGSRASLDGIVVGGRIKLICSGNTSIF